MHTTLMYPSPPGETVPSMAARYRIAMHAGTRGPGGFYGRSSRPASSLLPTHLEDVARLSPQCSRVSPTSLIQSHTGMPFFWPFIDTERAARARVAAVEGGSLHFTLGITSHRSLEPEGLRMCPCCVKADITEYGFPYWHREHQFRFVLVCPFHDIPLHEANFSVRSLFCSPQFPALTESIKTHVLPLPADPTGAIRALARDTSRLLQLPPQHVGMDRIYALIYRLLGARELHRIDGSVKVTRLSRQMVEYLGQDLLAALRCEPTGPVHQNWIAQICRKPRTLIAPHKVILMSHFLGMDILNFLNVAATTAPRPPRPPGRPHSSRIKSPERLARLLPGKRSRWLELQSQPRTPERLNLYCWLWRNSREWLRCHPGPKFVHSTPRRAWRQIDAQVRKTIRRGARDLRRSWPPVRASRHRLASLTPYAHYLLSNDIHRFPRSILALRALEETAVEYSCRRIRASAKNHPQIREKPWRLISVAGIGQGQARAPEVKRLIARMTLRGRRT